MNPRAFLTLILTLVTLGLIACQTEAKPAPPTETAQPEPTPITYPDGATLFIVDRSESGARYRITETFLENVSIEVPNREPGDVQAIGNTPALEGTLAMDLTVDPPQVLGGHFVADLNLLRTNQPRRDERLRSEWLQTYTYPTATFIVDEQSILTDPYVPGSEMTFPLTGEITVRDLTLPITFQTTATLSDDFQTITATADADMLISDFGIEPPSLANILEVDDPFQIGAILVARQEE